MSAWNDATPVTLSMTGAQHALLKHHLFPGDGKEAAALALCSRRAGDHRHRLVVREIHGIPYEACTERSAVRVSWPTDIIEPWLEYATDHRLSVVKIHSHPTDYRAFSETDDIGDRKFLPAVRGWVEAEIPHCSAIMLPSGEMLGRVLTSRGDFAPLASISVVGPDLHFWYPDGNTLTVPSFMASHGQAFGEGTIAQLQKLWIAVVGCSGTGSPVIEQLVRLGVGVIVLIDDDLMGDRNVNRILNSTAQDAKLEVPKVDMLAAAIERMGLNTRVIRLKKNLWDPEAVRLVAQCDAVFGCMDTVDGRYLLNRLATYYTLPYFDVGVRLDAVPDGPDKGRIREICGTVHYLQPGGSSLMSRGLFTMQQVAEAALKRNDPDAYQQNLGEGYISGVEEHRPAVISVNMYFASLCVQDFLNRLHPYREQPNAEIESITASLSSLEFFYEPEGKPCRILESSVGKGDVTPLLHTPELSEGRP